MRGRRLSMRLSSFILAAVHVLAASAAQLPLHAPTTASTTLVDVLSADPDYSSLLRLLQRARLVPTLNRLNGSTLFAPTNDAIERHSSSHPLWHAALQSNNPLIDNVQEKLRQQLLYHLLNYTVQDLPTEHSPRVLHTLHFPRKPPEHPTHKPPPSPPWIPVPGGSLGGAPQRLRITPREDHVYVGVDASGNGGTAIVKSKVNATNGVVYGIADLLVPPPDLGQIFFPQIKDPSDPITAQVVSQQSSLSYLRKIINPAITNLLNSSTELTLFLPVDSAWDALDPYERLYLESEFAADDILRILNMHAVIEKGVRWSDSLKPSTSRTCKLYGSMTRSD